MLVSCSSIALIIGDIQSAGAEPASIGGADGLVASSISKQTTRQIIHPTKGIRPFCVFIISMGGTEEALATWLMTLSRWPGSRAVFSADPLSPFKRRQEKDEATFLSLLSEEGKKHDDYVNLAATSIGWGVPSSSSCHCRFLLGRGPVESIVVDVHTPPVVIDTEDNVCIYPGGRRKQQLPLPEIDRRRRE